jgi:hypothetical protein
MKISIFFLLMFHSLLSFSGCPTATTACSKITNKDNCGKYYLETGCTENRTTTYCYHCSLCVAGANNCIKGTAGCNKCKIKNGTYTCTGMQCKWGDYCFNGGGKISCTK